ncbi:uncharacterized protein LOC111097589 [Canis lupus familiaris]|uniref:uncharacterized protein LOC111097589 n=1 Tax=Canis lupus familiaris TaxID=9615 RepID=UPI0015F12D42|nr:uncharacterized protein LOC111097589 [Canis lupus familiaris]XP_038488150.1 uncharacterized protein LOC111097589 [Canis lupus familiaris]XP_038534742.1 uncharacterized protein LOC111097589 [Canis lupus familiaris]
MTLISISPDTLTTGYKVSGIYPPRKSRPELPRRALHNWCSSKADSFANNLTCIIFSEISCSKLLLKYFQSGVLGLDLHYDVLCSSPLCSTGFSTNIEAEIKAYLPLGDPGTRFPPQRFGASLGLSLQVAKCPLNPGPSINFMVLRLTINASLASHNERRMTGGISSSTSMDSDKDLRPTCTVPPEKELPLCHHTWWQDAHFRSGSGCSTPMCSPGSPPWKRLTWKHLASNYCWNEPGNHPTTSITATSTTTTTGHRQHNCHQHHQHHRRHHHHCHQHQHHHHHLHCHQYHCHQHHHHHFHQHQHHQHHHRHCHQHHHHAHAQPLQSLI